MKVSAKQVKQIEVVLDDFTVTNIVLSQFCNVFNITIDYYIEDDKVMEDGERWGGSHSWLDQKVIRVATEEDKMAITILKKLKQGL